MSAEHNADKAWKEISRYGEDMHGCLMSCDDGEYVYYSAANEIFDFQRQTIEQLQSQVKELGRLNENLLDKVYELSRKNTAKSGSIERFIRNNGDY